ncbi:GNAT family N-acetyltransferase [Nitrosomonas communis]|uniref:Acetyltransferase (GNAT) domain-containing protein n=1 Tax=Nitrosomonas communis TaxID=44574 RepID=A0A1I4S357_9PROT|nr:GNAT family N-acetyltransferase [Nitrosomonas communis]SFM58710.1 Acetyltransferase (GNAT) domain-containing protein [Nitrosomonas communis]
MKKANILTNQRVDYEIVKEINFSELRVFLRDVADLYPNFYIWLNFTFFRNLASEERKIALAHNGNDILGVALLKSDAFESKICTFYVDPAFRGMNIGGKLMDLSISALDDPDTFITVCDERKSELIPLLSSRGFTLERSVDGLYYPHSSEHFYKL